MTEPKIVSLIKQAKAMKVRMNELKETSPEVAEYVRLDSARSDLHKEITGHINRYNVNPDLYKANGLIGARARWVRVDDIETLAQIKPKLKPILLPLINEKQTFYTK